MSKKNKEFHQEELRQAKIKTKRLNKRIMTAFGCLFLLAIFQVIHLQAFHTYKRVNLDEQSKKMYELKTVDQAERGIITDAQGNELAINVDTYKLYATLDPEHKALDGTPYYVEDRDGTAAQLLAALGLSDDPTATELFYSQLNQDAKQVEFGRYGQSLNIEQKNNIAKLNLPGISFEKNTMRYYPYGDFASYAVGFTTTEDGKQVGALGTERDLDGNLRGENGEIISSLDAYGNPINNEESVVVTPKSDGTNVQLTIDANIQAIVQEQMQEALGDKSFDLAYTLVTDVETGEILAMHSAPSFNPNDKVDVNYTNPFTQYLLEPGSTIKTFLVAEAIESGKWNPQNTTKTGYTTRDNWGGITIGDWVYNKHKTSWGSITWEEGYYVSSNTVMLDVLDQVGYDQWIEALKNNWKFGTSVDSTYLKTESGSVNPHQPIEKANTAFGQGMSVNAIQMAQAYSAIGNDGVMTTPHLVKQITDANTGEVVYNSADDTSLQQTQVISDTTAKTLIEMMKNVVTYNGGRQYMIGTGYLADGSPVPLAIKTGTSQIAGNGGYGSGEISSYATLAPADNPEVFIYTVLVNCNSSYLDFYGEMVKDIATNTINYLTNKSNGQEISADTNRIELANFAGQNIAEVTANLTNEGFKVISYGDGIIQNQYPSASQVISRDQFVILRGENVELGHEALIGLTQAQARGVCSVMSWNCNFSGSGEIVNIESVDQSTVTIYSELPTRVNEEIDKRRQSEGE